MGALDSSNPYQSSVDAGAASDAQANPLKQIVPHKDLSDDEVSEVYRQAGMDPPKGKGRQLIKNAWDQFTDQAEASRNPGSGARDLLMGSGPVGALLATISRPGPGAQGAVAPQGSTSGGASPVGGQVDFSNMRAAGGKQDERNAPAVRPGSVSRSMGAGLGAGNKRTPSSPSTTNGRSEVTQAPRSADPKASDTSDVEKDPAVKQLSALLKKYTGGESDQVDLSPLAALSDSWSHGHLLQGYDRPLGNQEKAKLQAQLAENLARRQSDLEWHKARMAQYGAHDQTAENVARIRAQGQVDARQVGADSANYRTDHQVIRGAGGRGGAGKPQSPEQEARSAFSANSGILKNIVMSNYSGDPKALSGATQETHQFADHVARKYMEGGMFPDYKSAYNQAVKDLPEYMRKGVVAPRGMRYHGANQIQQPQVAPQDGAPGAE